MQPMSCRPKRRRLVVDRAFQWSLCQRILLLGLFVLFAMVCGVFAPLLWDLSGGAAKDSNNTDAAIAMLYLHHSFWIVVAVAFVFVAFGAVRLSHRIAGPLVRYKRNLRLIAEGKLPPPLVTRSGDYLKEEVACLNVAVAGVRERVEAIRTAAAKSRRALRAAHELGVGCTAVDLEAALEAQRELDQCLGAFTETGDLDSLPVAVQPHGGVVLAFQSVRARER